VTVYFTILFLNISTRLATVLSVLPGYCWFLVDRSHFHCRCVTADAEVPFCFQKHIPRSCLSIRHISSSKSNNS